MDLWAFCCHILSFSGKVAVHTFIANEKGGEEYRAEMRSWPLAECPNGSGGSIVVFRVANRCPHDEDNLWRNLLLWGEDRECIHSTWNAAIESEDAGAIEECLVPGRVGTVIERCTFFDEYWAAG